MKHYMMTYKHKLCNVPCGLLLCGLLLALAGCSTTRALPDDEQLYTGIDKITYADDPAMMRKKERDSVGVITAVADAVSEINSANGRPPTVASPLRYKLRLCGRAPPVCRAATGCR